MPWDPAFGPYPGDSPPGPEEDPTGIEGRWLRVVDWEVAGAADPGKVLMDRIEAVEGLVTQLLAGQAGDIRRLRTLRLGQQSSDRQEASDDDAWIAGEVGWPLGLSDNQVRSKLAFADALTRLPRVASLVHDGAAPAFTCVRLAERLTVLADLLDEEALAATEEKLVSWIRADRPTVTALSRKLTVIEAAARSRREADDDGAGVTARRAARRVRVTSRDDGTSELWALLPDVDALALAAVLDAASSAVPPDGGDTRSREQRRADILVARITGSPATLGAATDVPQGRLPEKVEVLINVTVPVGTTTGGHHPGTTPDHQILPAVTIRDLLDEPAVRYRGVFYDPDTGHLLGATGPTDPDARLDRITMTADIAPTARYEHTPTMDDHTTMRDRTCRAGSCPRRARHCDSDHIMRFPDGPTSPANTARLCRHHHRQKTHAPRWRVEGSGDGPLTWTTPSNRKITTNPHDHRPDIDLPDDPPF